MEQTTLLKWNSVQTGVFSSKLGDLVFILKKHSVGVYGMGETFSLSVRKMDDIKPIHVASFWTKSDGGYGTYPKSSVDGKLWFDIGEIQIKAQEILKNEHYIE